MNKEHIEIAKGLSAEVRRQYPDISVTSIRFVGISGDRMDVSALPYNLADATSALVICNFDYQIHAAYRSDFFALFIDGEGGASDMLEIDGWTISLDEPGMGAERQPMRHITLWRGGLTLDISCVASEVSDNIPALWSFFRRIRTAADEEINRIIAPYKLGNTLFLSRLARDYR